MELEDIHEWTWFQISDDDGEVLHFKDRGDYLHIRGFETIHDDANVLSVSASVNQVKALRDFLDGWLRRTQKEDGND